MTSGRLATLAALALCVAAAALPRGVSAERPPARVFTTADGLPAILASRVLADSRGFLWFATHDGLTRFDGYTFTTYTADDGLPDRGVTSVLESRDGAYWVGTFGGLARFDPHGLRGSAEAPPLREIPLGGERGTHVISLFESADARLWAGTASGLYLIEGEEGARVGPGDKGVTEILDDRLGGLWLGTDRGELRRLRRDGAVEAVALPGGAGMQGVSALYENSDGRLWVGRRGGLCVSAPRAAADPPIFEETVPALWTTDFLERGESDLLVSTTHGLWRANRSGGTASLERVAAVDGVCDREVWGMAEDRSGDLWLATTCGAVRLRRYGFTTFSREDGLASAQINSIFESAAGDLVVTTNQARRHVHRFDGRRFIAIEPNLPPEAGASQGWGWGQTALQDREGAWWVAHGDAAYRFPPATRPEAIGRSRASAPIRNGEAFRLFEDSRGDVWMSASGTSVRRWERASGREVDVTAATGFPADSGIVYTAFCEDRGGGVWIGTDRAGLLRYYGGAFTRYAPGSGAPGGWVRWLFVDSAGRLWAASNVEGLVCVENPADASPRFRTYARADGLSTNNVYSVTEDEWGRIYVGVTAGVDRLDLATGRVKHFTTADGLPNGHVEVSYRDRGGRLWFGTPFGLARLEPEPDHQRPPPHTLVTAVRAGGAARPVSSLGETAISGLDLAANENSVTVEFVGLGASLGEPIAYEYTIEGGGDEGWSRRSPERSVSFASLSAGSYRFLVRAIGEDGAASPEPAAVAFTVAAPMWQRWWFLALAAAVAAAAAYAMHRYRVRYLLEVERVRTHIATDLHDDIGANLTRIAILSEVARNPASDGGSPGESLDAIAAISRESVASMSDIVWAINPKRDSVDDLVRRMRRFAEEAFASRGVALEFRGPEHEGGMRLDHETRRQLFLVFKECIANALRHSGCAHAEIELRAGPRRLVLAVSDDGRGFDPSSAAEGNGLESMRRRAAALGGTLEVDSAPGGGTRVTLSLPPRASTRAGRPLHMGR
jgi:signal transduction histidine kinase/ligand-binding sensor domain-containing protein